MRLALPLGLLAILVVATAGTQTAVFLRARQLAHIASLRARFVAVEGDTTRRLEASHLHATTDLGDLSQNPASSHYIGALAAADRLALKRERRTFIHRVDPDQDQSPVQPIDAPFRLRDGASVADKGIWNSKAWPSSRPLESIQQEGLVLLALVDARTATCNNMVHFGGAREHGAGEFAVCVDAWIGFGSHGGYGRSDAHTWLGGNVGTPCLVYSFGIASDFTFDDAMAASGCEVHTFDPSLGVANHVRTSHVQFHNVGLAQEDFDYEAATRGGSNTGDFWKVRRFWSHLKHCQHRNRIVSVVKMDLEGAEWKTLAQMLQGEEEDIGNEQRSVLATHVAQLVVEVHLFVTPPVQTDSDVWPDEEVLEKVGLKPGHHSHMHTALASRIRANILRALYDLGFDLVWTHQNPMSAVETNFLGHRKGEWDLSTDAVCCAELTFVNRNLQHHYFHPSRPRWIQHARSQIH